MIALREMTSAKELEFQSPRQRLHRYDDTTKLAAFNVFGRYPCRRRLCTEQEIGIFSRQMTRQLPDSERCAQVNSQNQNDCLMPHRVTNR